MVGPGHHWPAAMCWTKARHSSTEISTHIKQRLRSSLAALAAAFCVLSLPTFFLSRAPWSALAAVGRGASGEKDMSLVKATDELYKAKVKPYGLR